MSDHARVVAQLRTLDELAASDRTVPFTALVQIEQLARRRPALQPDPADVQRTLLHRFETQTGRIDLRYGCLVQMGGVAVVAPATGAVRLETVCNAYDPRLVAIETRCHELADLLAEVTTRAPGLRQASRAVVGALYAVMTEVLALSDAECDPVLRSRTDPAARKAARQDFERGVTSAGRSLAAAERRARTVAQRAVRSTYLAGVGIGIVLTLAVVAAVTAVAAHWWRDYLSAPALAAATIFGVFGAMVSVFQRITKGTLQLDPTASRAELLAQGSVRPFVGAVSAAVAELALGAGLFAATASGTSATASTPAIGSFAVIGFVAGFSERFAIDAAQRAGVKLAADDPPDPTAVAPTTTPADPTTQVTTPAAQRPGPGDQEPADEEQAQEPDPEPHQEPHQEPDQGPDRGGGRPTGAAPDPSRPEPAAAAPDGAGHGAPA